MSNTTTRSILWPGEMIREFSAGGHPITNNWFLLESPGPLVSVLVLYHMFCSKTGPEFMKNRAPFNLKPILIVYNLVNVIVSAWIFYEGLWAGWLYYSFKCQPLEPLDNPRAHKMAQVCWVYFMCKLFELLETVFFVLRKKNSQVSYLHLYHHTIMPIGSWLLAKFIPGGHSSIVPLLNSLVHVVMYSYYLLAALGPEFHKYLWWKKYLTKLQLVQFLTIFFHHLPLFFIECNYPKWIAVITTFNASYFFYLFAAFYIRTYNSKKNKKVE